MQKALNALYGGLMYMRNNREAAVKLIGDLYEIPADIAAAEYENTILKLETDGSMAGDRVKDAVGAVAGTGEARRHEGYGAGGRDHLDPVQAGADQALRPI